MKKIYWIIPFVFLLGIIASCKSSKKTSTTEAKSEEPVQQLIYYNQPLDSLATDYYDIDSVALDGQYLLLYVNYGGGCGDVKFDMYYQPQKILVMPHRASLFLKLTDNDPCRSIVTKKLIFDLSVMDKEAKAGGVVLSLGDKKITYKISGTSTF